MTSGGSRPLDKGRGGGGGGGSHPDPEIRGGGPVSNFFGRKVRGAQAPQAPPLDPPLMTTGR